MPTYQYVCTQCEAPLEIVQAFSDDALTVCPSCGAEALRKVYGSVGVVFKGSGFYRNDSRGSSSTATLAAATTGTSTESSPASAPAAPAASPAATPSPTSPSSNTTSAPASSS